MDLACNPLVAAMHPYTPGEQPQGPGWIKLNTNEFPFPPAPAVLDAIAANMANRDQGNDSARKYPDPHCIALREAIADSLGRSLTTSNILMGNGSDEILRLLFHAYLDPKSQQASQKTVAVLNPTYSLYDTLAAMFGATIEHHTALEDQGDRLPQAFVQSTAAVAIIANPNPPLGTLYSHSEIRRLLTERPGRLTILDEAYVDFAGGATALDLLAEFPNLAVSRTFSKGMALAGLRLGYLVASPAIILHLDRIRDSYNINALTQIAGRAAVGATDYYRGLIRQIMDTREATAQELQALGFRVPPSHGNFLFARHPEALGLLAGLRSRKILVRHFAKPDLADGLRITIGTSSEMEALLGALRDQMAAHR